MMLENRTGLGMERRILALTRLAATKATRHFVLGDRERAAHFVARAHRIRTANWHRLGLS